MPRLAYVNGRYRPHDQASVHIEDRGYQFADGVYEVVPILRRRLVDEAGHIRRLQRSLGELRIDLPLAIEALRFVARELIDRNRITNGLLYVQITRGVAPREHAFPMPATKPSIVMTTRPMKGECDPESLTGIAVITLPDIRWRRPDIKSVSLLPNILAKQQAVEAGAGEAWLLDDDGFITEGSATNAWIVAADGKLVTRNAGKRILNGITRLGLMALLDQLQLEVEERAFSKDEALAAREAFISGSGGYVIPVTKIDGNTVSDGSPGPVTRRLQAAYAAFARGE